MSSLSTRNAAIIVVILVIAALLTALMANGGGPSNATIKKVVEKEMQARMKGCVVLSISITRGKMFIYQGRRGVAGYGTAIYPVAVKAVYTVPLDDGSRSENREFKRGLFLYKSPSHEWLSDHELN